MRKAGEDVRALYVLLVTYYVFSIAGGGGDDRGLRRELQDHSGEDGVGAFEGGFVEVLDLLHETGVAELRGGDLPEGVVFFDGVGGEGGRRGGGRGGGRGGAGG